MDHKIILQTHLLSKTNIDLLVDLILKNFKISQKAITKCINIITGNLTKYLNNLERYPKNNNELIEAIKFLNKKCFDDFTTYLSTKYPNMNLLRTPSSPYSIPIYQEFNNFIPESQTESMYSQSPSPSPSFYSENSQINIQPNSNFGLPVQTNSSKKTAN